MTISRRRFMQGMTATLAGWTAGAGRAAAAIGDLSVPIRPITHGPKFHWFGYYDKLEFDPTNRYVLGMEVDFGHRSPGPDDVVKIGGMELAS
ncbi:MAG: hypothetical protein ACYC4U_14615 [Pirellulaceae bacterium]